MTAHDIGILLCQGASADINRPLATYVDLASPPPHRLLPSVVVPPQVQAAVERHREQYPSVAEAAPEDNRALPAGPAKRLQRRRGQTGGASDLVEEAGESSGSDGGVRRVMTRRSGAGPATGGRCSRASSLAPNVSPVPRFTD